MVNRVLHSKNTKVCKGDKMKTKTTKKQKIMCFFGFHKWEKLGGSQNVGNGKFKQLLICKSCGKTKRVID